MAYAAFASTGSVRRDMALATSGSRAGRGAMMDAMLGFAPPPEDEGEGEQGAVPSQETPPARGDSGAGTQEPVVPGVGEGVAPERPECPEEGEGAGESEEERQARVEVEAERRAEESFQRLVNKRARARSARKNAVLAASLPPRAPSTPPAAPRGSAISLPPKQPSPPSAPPPVSPARGHFGAVDRAGRDWGAASGLEGGVSAGDGMAAMLAGMDLSVPEVTAPAPGQGPRITTGRGVVDLQSDGVVGAVGGPLAPLAHGAAAGHVDWGGRGKAPVLGTSEARPLGGGQGQWNAHFMARYNLQRFGMFAGGRSRPPSGGGAGGYGGGGGASSSGTSRTSSAGSGGSGGAGVALLPGGRVRRGFKN